MSTVITARMRAFLDAPRLAVLSTVDEDGSPHLAVLWYELQRDSTLLMNGRSDHQRVINLQRDPRAALTVSTGDRYMAIYGTVTLIDDQATAHRDFATLARRYHGADDAATMAAEVKDESRVTIRMQIERVDEVRFEDVDD